MVIDLITPFGAYSVIASLPRVRGLVIVVASVHGVSEVERTGSLRWPHNVVFPAAAI